MPKKISIVGKEQGGDYHSCSGKPFRGLVDAIRFDTNNRQSERLCFPVRNPKFPVRVLGNDRQIDIFSAEYSARYAFRRGENKKFPCKSPENRENFPVKRRDQFAQDCAHHHLLHRI